MFMCDFKVKCIVPKQINGGSVGFTAGKIYKVEHGKLIDDSGIVGWPILNSDKFRSINDIKNYKNGNWSYIGEFVEV